MKVKVLRNFYDKANDETLRKAGDELVISQERYEEILSVGDFVEEIKEVEEDKETKEDKEVEEDKGIKEEPKKSTKKKVGADDGVKG